MMGTEHGMQLVRGPEYQNWPNILFKYQVPTLLLIYVHIMVMVCNWHTVIYRTSVAIHTRYALY